MSPFLTPIKDGDSGNNTGWDCGWVDYVQGPGTPPPLPDPLTDAVDLNLTFTTGGTANWFRQTSTYYNVGDAAESGDISDYEQSWMETTVDGPGTLTFYWKVSSESGYDYLEFYIDTVLQSGRISGSTDRTQKSYNITGAGTHTLKWRYVKDSSVSEGSDCGWVDYVQWSGAMPPVYTPIPETWETVTYTYDAGGRRIAKAFDGQTCLKYIYDGDQHVAEYDGNNNLLRKYVYGPGIDKPVCMINVEHSNATYYYHLDALGSVVALSNSSGNTVEVYEYSVYGEVGASDPNHMNLFMFTGREFDRESGLYYYRARYYNPEIGRFLQTDPVGYAAGMNLYLYCENNPLNLIDQFGHAPNKPNEPCGIPGWYWSPNCTALAAHAYLSGLKTASGGKAIDEAEYFYFILYKWNDDIDSYIYAWTGPIRGTLDYVPLKEIRSHEKEVKRAGYGKTSIFGWGHNHPKSGISWMDAANEEFSGEKGDRGFSENLWWHTKKNAAVMYLFTPSGGTKSSGRYWGGKTQDIATTRDWGLGGECTIDGGKK